MSKISELIIDIQWDLENGVFTNEEIAHKYNIPTEWVQEVAKEYFQPSWPMEY
jgi:hypothetical protein